MPTQEYCSASEDLREKVLKHWVRNWFSFLRDMPEDFEDVKPDLLPVVRSRSHFELNQLRGEVESGTPLSLAVPNLWGTFWHRPRLRSA